MGKHMRYFQHKAGFFDNFRNGLLAELQPQIHFPIMISGIL